MYVRWKTLLSLGAIFWTLLCLTDYFFYKIDYARFFKGKANVNFYDSKAYGLVLDDRNWLRDVSEKELLFSKGIEEDQPHIKESDLNPTVPTNIGFGLVVMNSIGFLIAIALCHGLKTFCDFMWKLCVQPVYR